WSVHARVKHAAGLAWASPSHPLKARWEADDLLLDGAGKDVPVDRDVVLQLTPKGEGARPEGGARFSATTHEGARYLMLRYRPQLAGPVERQRRDWVVLFESSGDRDPLLARVQGEVIRELLSHAEPEDTFAVLAAGTRVRAFRKDPVPLTAENVQAAVEFLEGAHLVGALDLGRALAEAEPLLKRGKNPYLVHVGSGLPAMGERREDVLAKRIPAAARYVGVGVGRRWARGLMKAAAERTGGSCPKANPDEPVAWRAFDLFATLSTPRLLDARVSDPGGKARFLGWASTVAQGEELCAVTRLAPGETDLPKSVAVRGV